LIGGIVRRWQRLRLGLVLAGLLIAISCHAIAESMPPTGETARLGFYMKIARDLNRADVRASLDVWADELTRKFQVPAEVRYYSDIELLRRDFDAGRVNLVIADAMTFVRHFKPEELADGFTTKLSTDASLLLLARPDGDGLKRLTNQRIARLDDDEVSVTFLETLCLRRMGKTCAALPLTIVTVPNNHQALTRLLFGQVDLALVNRHGLETAVELNPQLRKAGVVVDRLDFETQFFGFYSAAVSPEFRRFSLRSIPNMHLESRGRQMLDVFKTDRVALAEPTLLKAFYQLEREYQELKAASARKGRKP
jgi:ABC-type amino acid transport substrate-binding protein